MWFVKRYLHLLVLLPVKFCQIRSVDAEEKSKLSNPISCQDVHISFPIGQRIHTLTLSTSFLSRIFKFHSALPEVKSKISRLISCKADYVCIPIVPEKLYLKKTLSTCFLLVLPNYIQWLQWRDQQCLNQYKVRATTFVYQSIRKNTNLVDEVEDFSGFSNSKQRFLRGS